jgi:hypothetical protein
MSRVPPVGTASPTGDIKKRQDRGVGGEGKINDFALTKTVLRGVGGEGKVDFSNSLLVHRWGLGLYFNRRILNLHEIIYSIGFGDVWNLQPVMITINYCTRNLSFAIAILG